MITTRTWPFRAAGAPDPDSALLARARQGEQGAFDTLRGRHERPLRSFVSRQVGEDAADDVAQEVWLACWLNLGRYASRSRFKAWLYGVALNKCAEHRRDRARSERQRQAAEQRAYASSDASNRRSFEVRQTVQAALDTLPEAQCEVIELYYYAELTLADIAQATGRNLNTVKYQFYRAHAVVSEALGRQGELIP